jgi:SAM-dependent methyltransferase
MTVSWTDRVAALRPAYQADLAQGTERFFQERRTTCPWCDSAELRVRLRTTDLIQHKPGRFVLDECTACGHVFQNPRLNDTGLEFYYRDFYDGLGEEQLDGLFKSSTKAYLSRARLAVAHAEPGNWLDVGTGHGHFPHTAATLLPNTVFDGLDQSEGVELAQRRGWITTGYRGHFPDLADSLAGQYDAVSMFHYLEHTTDPAAQLAAASRVVRPGGLLLIEVPDPECRYANLLGRWWMPWLQPQHLHFVPLPNLTKRLTELGFTVLAEQHGAAHSPIDLVAATWLAMDNSYVPSADLPWFTGVPGRLRRGARIAAILAGVPALLLSNLADRIVGLFAQRARLTNAYRVLARRS